MDLCISSAVLGPQNGYTALRHAAFAGQNIGRKACFNMLISHGADVNIPDKVSCQPCKFAEHAGRIGTI